MVERGSQDTRKTRIEDYRKMYVFILSPHLVDDRNIISFTFVFNLMNVSREAEARMTTDYLGYAFGAVVAAGGAMGFVKKRSVPSLVAGLAFGGLAMAGAYHVREHL